MQGFWGWGGGEERCWEEGRITLLRGGDSLKPRLQKRLLIPHRSTHIPALDKCRALGCLRPCSESGQHSLRWKGGRSLGGRREQETDKSPEHNVPANACLYHLAPNHPRGVLHVVKVKLKLHRVLSPALLQELAHSLQSHQVPCSDAPRFPHQRWWSLSSQPPKRTHPSFLRGHEIGLHLPTASSDLAKWLPGVMPRPRKTNPLPPLDVCVRAMI